MNVKNQLSAWAKGKVWGHFIDLETGAAQPPFVISNIITYAAADIMARLVGGDTSYIPGYMGFIYGTTATPSIVDPITSRVQNWTDLGTELSGVNKANVLISPFASNAQYLVDSDITVPAGVYNGNAVVLSSHTGTRLEYGFPAGAVYADPLADLNYLYHVMLITRLVSGSTITYLPFARVSLKQSGNYPQKPAGMELALFWQITFN